MNKGLQLTLKIAGIYNILWGIIVGLFPYLMFDLLQIERINYPMIWQSVGMIVGVYGLGYYLASQNYVKHWIIVLVGFLGKVFGPIGIFFYVAMGQLSPGFLIVTFLNDLIWLIPFTKMLLEAYREHGFRDV
jgi:hypothetical protein